MIKIIAVGKIKEPGLQMLVKEYQKRLSGYSKIAIVELKDLKIPNNASEADCLKIIEQEGQNIMAKLHQDDTVILLDLHGASLDSVQMAEKFENWRTYSRKDLVFVIGGSLGVSDTLRKRAKHLWKLSDLTFTHQFTRVIVLEQIYRFFKINNNENYHK